MKTVLVLSVLLGLIAAPALAELTTEDFDRIRLIIKEELESEIKPIKADIVSLKTDVAWMRAKLENVDERFKGVDKQFENVDKRFDAVDKRFDTVDRQFESVDRQISHVTYVTYGLIALIVAAIAIPQILIAWRSGKDRAVERQVETLTLEIETLKRQLSDINLPGT